MQNTSLAHRGAAPLPYGRFAGACLAFITCAILFVSLLVAPSTALAKSYSMPRVDIDATLAADGSLHVVEERTFDFSGDFTCVWWEFNKLYGDKQLQPNGVEIALADSFSDEVQPAFEAVPEVPFDIAWRSEGGPGYAAYSLDVNYDDVYVFFSASDTQMRVRIDYTVLGAVDVYEDVAELYWQYQGPGWAEDSRNVFCTITLPSGSGGVAGDTVRAWGHGPLDGKVELNEDATQIAYTVNLVKSGEFAEARVVFPIEWLSLPAGYRTHSYNGLPDILEEEKSWAQEANRGRIASLVFFGVFGLVAFLAVAWAAVQFFRYGREYRPNFTEKYWRDVPNKAVHPAVIGRLLNWNHEKNDDVLATLLHLANKGVVSIDRGTRVVGTKKGKGCATVFASDANQTIDSASGDVEEGYYLRLASDAADKLDNEIDKNLVGFLFGDISADGATLWLDDISEWGEAHKKSFNNKMEKWQKVVSRQVKNANYFEDQGFAEADFANTLAWIMGIAGIYLSIEMDNFVPVVFFGIATVALLAFSVFMPRRTREGAEDYARAKALKRWLSDFTLLKERVPTDVKVWGEFMVYAQLFGVADKVIKQLRDAVPEMFAVPGSGGSAGHGSWVFWYDTPVTRSSAHGSFATSFADVWSNTASSAAAAASVVSSGGGGWSSGGGFGGGFSGGGGGGFGGGGGGAR